MKIGNMKQENFTIVKDTKIMIEDLIIIIKEGKMIIIGKAIMETIIKKILMHLLHILLIVQKKK